MRQQCKRNQILTFEMIRDFLLEHGDWDIDAFIKYACPSFPGRFGRSRVRKVFTGLYQRYIRMSGERR